MENLQFEEDAQYTRSQLPDSNQPYFIRLLLQYGIVKDQRQAEYVLIGFCVIAVFLSFVIWITFNSSPHYTPQNTNNSAYQLNAQYGGK